MRMEARRSGIKVTIKLYLKLLYSGRRCGWMKLLMTNHPCARSSPQLMLKVIERGFEKRWNIWKRLISFKMQRLCHFYRYLRKISLRERLYGRAGFKSFFQRSSRNSLRRDPTFSWLRTMPAFSSGLSLSFLLLTRVSLQCSVRTLTWILSRSGIPEPEPDPFIPLRRLP